MTNATKTVKTARTPAIAVKVDPKQMLLNAVFSNGKQLNIHASELSLDIQAMCMMHGLKQKLVDAAAISRDPETGRSAGIAEKYQAVMAVVERLSAGEWNLPREGGGSGSLLFKAVCRVYGSKAPEALKAWLDGKTDEQKKALKLNPTIAAAIAEIQAEAIKDSDIDSDDLLNEIDEIE
jgi:hypothetical protein